MPRGIRFNRVSAVLAAAAMAFAALPDALAHGSHGSGGGSGSARNGGSIGSGVSSPAGHSGSCPSPGTGKPCSASGHAHHPVHPVGFYYGYPAYAYGYAYASYASAYERMGEKWAEGLQRGTVTTDQFVGYLQAHLLDAKAWAVRYFRRGFLSAYVGNGQATWDQAWSRARGTATTLPAYKTSTAK